MILGNHNEQPVLKVDLILIEVRFRPPRERLDEL